MSDIKSYLPEFDDFQEYIIRRKQKLSEKQSTQPPLQLFFYYYYIHYGVEFLRNINATQAISQRSLNKFIYNAEIQQEKAKAFFSDLLIQYKLQKYYDIFSPYIPFTIYTIKALICNLKDIINIKELSKLYALALWYSCIGYGYYLYDNKKSKYENQDIYIRKNLRAALEQLSKTDEYLFVNTFCRTFVKIAMINKVQFIKYYPLSNSYILSINPTSQYISDGSFDLPWSYVNFMNGYMFLYHPSFPDGGSNHLPLRHNDEKSRKALNNIKGYIIKKLTPIKVTAEKNRIVAIQDINQISEAVEYLHVATKNEQVKLLEKEKSQTMSNSIHDQDSSEVLEKLKLYKSKYLEYLSDISLVNYKVFYALEARVNSSEISTTEVAFIFTLKQDQDHTLVVYENNLPARASVCFVINREYYNEAIDVINNFFSSDNINKRDMLMSNSVEFDKTCIARYFRVNHDDFNLWKFAIKEM